jgi:hypothetical protein
VGDGLGFQVLAARFQLRACLAQDVNMIAMDFGDRNEGSDDAASAIGMNRRRVGRTIGFNGRRRS